MTGPPTPPHLADGEIIALLDGEHGMLSDAARRHLDKCDACRERRDRFSEYDAFVREELSTISVPIVDEALFRRRVASRTNMRNELSSPSRRWRRPRWVAVAAIAGLAAVAAASPVRRWLLSFVDTPTAHQSADRPAPPSAPQSPSSGGSVSFAPTTATFTLRLDSVPAAGVVVVETTDDDKITASVVSGASTGGDAFVVLPAELRIRNSSQARASYRIALPRSVTQFRAVVAGSAVYEGGAPASITLSRR